MAEQIYTLFDQTTQPPSSVEKRYWVRDHPGTVAEAQKLFAAGEGSTKISRKLGIHPHTIAKWQRKFGWKIDPISSSIGESWKAAVGCETTHRVSSHGRVCRLIKGKGWRLLHPRKSSHGYCQVSLRSNGRRQYIFVHKLVVEAFVGPRPAGHEINHKDRNKENNNFNNLEYVTPKENIQHSLENGLPIRRRLGRENHSARLTDDAVRKVRDEIAAGSLSLAKIARRHGVGQTCIHKIRDGITWRHVT